MQELHQNSVNLPVGIMDLDSDLTLVENTNATYAFAIRNGYGAILGSATNMKGNELVQYPLPAGTNTCIGTFEDLRGESLVYFVANSNGNHLILRYFPNSGVTSNGHIVMVAQGSALNFNTDWLITHAALIDGKLLYWTDAYTDKQQIEGNPPRMLNIERGVIEDKNLTYKVYAGLADQGQFADAVINNTSLTFQFYDKATGNPTALTTTIPPGILVTLANNPSAILQYVADVINTIYPQVASAEFCDCETAITLLVDNLTLSIFETNAPQPDLFFVADNHYPSPLQEHHIDLIKYPPIYEPTPEYQVNTDLSYNKVNREAFQFRVRYWYSDSEKSAWGPISIVALNVEQDGQILDLLNEIKVVFTEDRLNDPSFLSMIKFVEVAVRSSNEGIFRSVDVIKTCSIGIREQYIIFRNDKLYSAVESDDTVVSGQSQVLKKFDFVPILCGAIDSSSDRNGNSLLTTGANLEGYECPECTDISFNVNSEPPDDCLFTITGTFRVFNGLFNAANNAQPTFSLANTTLPPATFDEYLGVVPTPNRYWFFPGKTIDGFVVYLAGTPYYAISDNPNYGTTGTGQFTISGVPKGRYILRIASHLCCFEDTKGQIYNINRGIGWQKTSTFVYRINGDQNSREIFIDLTSVVGNTIDIGFLDLLNPASPNPYTPPSTFNPFFNMITAYLLDNDGQIDSNLNDYAVRQGATMVEMQNISIYEGTVVFPGTIGTTEYSPIYSEGQVTDHNGFAYIFFWNEANYIFPIEQNPFIVRTSNTAVPIGIINITYKTFGNGLYGLETSNLVDTGNLNGAWNSVEVLIYNTSVSFTQNNKTLVRGSIYDNNGYPKENVLVSITECGRSEFTAANGNYSFAVYCPYYDNKRDFSSLFFTYLIDFCNEYPFSQNDILLNISDFYSDYNYDSPYNVSNTTMDISIGIVETKRYLKRGSSYGVGVVYGDRAGRESTVCAALDKLTIPYFNEIGEYSKPIATWSINHIPPIWATYYRIVRTKNSLYRRYLQWAIDDVRYVKIETPQSTPEDTTFSNGDATHILIDLGSITNADPSTNPVLFFFNNREDGAYDAEPFDRIRLIVDNFGAVLGDIFEYELEGEYTNNDRYYLVIKDPELLFEIFPGFIIEAYSPKSNEEIAFYDCGETYPILNPHTSSRAHGGQTQNQIPNIQPATGIFVGGDTYWRIEDFSVDNSNSVNKVLEHSDITSRYSSNVEDIGRVNIRDENYTQIFRFNDIRFSGMRISGSFINNLSSFRAGDIQQIDQRYGIIKKMITADKVLLVVCQNKIQPIYVGQDLVLELSGRSDLGRSDKILNLAEALKLDLGTNNPESVIEQDGTVYGWDVAKGVVWRYSMNGLFPISSYKATRYFSDLGKRLYKQPRKSTRVFGGFDREFGCYLMTFVADGVVVESPFTISFDEGKNGWNCYVPYTPSYYGRIGRRLVSFVAGALWLHESDNVPYNNFYGTQYQSLWRFVCNTSPKSVKLLWNIELQADNQWECSSITTPPNKDYAQGMRSRIKAANWSRQEGVWKADFLRDMNDTSARFLNIINPIQRELNALLYGRPLRAEAFEIELRLVDSTKKSILKRIDIEFSLSMETKV